MPPQHPNRRKARATAHFLKISHISLLLLAYLLTLLFFYRQGGLRGLALFSATFLIAIDIACFYLIFHSGWNTRLQEPQLITSQIIAAIAILFCVAWLDRASQLVLAPFVLIVFLFGASCLSTTALALLSAASLVVYLMLILFRTDQYSEPENFHADLMQWFVLLVALPSVMVIGNQFRQLRKILDITRYQLSHYEEQASRDELTGLCNRRQLQVELEQAKLRAIFSSEPFCLCLIDIDHFKDINDKSGHPAGDMVLSQFARMARDSIRSSDIFGRYGGDEFMKILPDTDLEGAVMHAERLRLLASQLDFQHVLAPLALSISISIGVAQYRHGEDVTTLIQRTDTALYRAKQLGRNRVEWAT